LGAHKVLAGTASVDWSRGRASAEQCFSLSLLLTDWRSASPSADLVLSRLTCSADSHYWLEDR
jgi:hypothetical protein